MLDEYTRKLAREAFEADIFDCYGAVEAGRISNECVKHTGYHILSDSVLVEITRDDKAVSTGEEGEVTVTNLNNYAMPFVRYNLGDLGVLIGDRCPCGRCFPLMRLTEGRKRGNVQLPDGRVTSAFSVSLCLNYVEGIKQFQIIQEEIGHFIVKILIDSKFTNSTIEDIKGELKQVLGDVEIDVSIVDSIARERSGKFRPFVTKVPVS